VDEEATPMEHKMCHPTLTDLHYILARWHHVWDRRREDAWAAAAGAPRRPPTPTHSVRNEAATELFGYPMESDVNAGIRQ
jgi:hypothetical protein